MQNLATQTPDRVESAAEARAIFASVEHLIAKQVSCRLEQSLAESRKIIFIYQMGKVGSTSYARCLEQFPGLDVHHTHRLNPGENQEMLESFLDKGLLKLALRERRWQAIYDFLQNHRGCVYFISAIRDPIARNMSAFFQNLHLSDSKNAAPLIEQFFTCYPHRVPLDWFETQFHQTFGINVLEKPFSKELGWSSFQEKGYHCLIMTAESSETQKIQALNEFLVTDLKEIPRENSGDSKDYAHIYKKFKNDINVPVNYMETMLNSPVISHFYTQDQISGFRRRWN